MDSNRLCQARGAGEYRMSYIFLATTAGLDLILVQTTNDNHTLHIIVNGIDTVVLVEVKG